MHNQSDCLRLNLTNTDLNNLLQKDKNRSEAQRAREPEIVLAFEISVSVSFRKYTVGANAREEV